MAEWAALVVAVVAAAVSYRQSNVAAQRAKSARAAAARERKKARDIQSAGQENADRIARRKAIREDRVRRARIIQLSGNTGTEGSSAAISTPGILGTNLGAAIAGQQGGRATSEGVSASLQFAADAEGTATQALAEGRRKVATTQAFASIATTAVTKTDLFK